MTDKTPMDDDQYVVAQPTDVKPEKLTIEANGTTITYSDYQGVVESSQVYPNHLAYGEMTVVENTTDTEYEVTD